MRFLKFNKKKTVPKDGDIRVRKVFLWFPKTQYGEMFNITRWLEQAIVKEKFEQGGVFYDNVRLDKWEFIKFIDKD